MLGVAGHLAREGPLNWYCNGFSVSASVVGLLASCEGVGGTQCSFKLGVHQQTVSAGIVCSKL